MTGTHQVTVAPLVLSRNCKGTLPAMVMVPNKTQNF